MAGNCRKLQEKCREIQYGTLQSHKSPISTHAARKTNRHNAPSAHTTDKWPKRLTYQWSHCSVFFRVSQSIELFVGVLERGCLGRGLFTNNFHAKESDMFEKTVTPPPPQNRKFDFSCRLAVSEKIPGRTQHHHTKPYQGQKGLLNPFLSWIRRLFFTGKGRGV